MTQHTLRSGDWEATVATRGAELQTLSAKGQHLLWDAGPLWPRHAPLLFPVVGALKGDHLRHQGAILPMPKHGFARESEFSLVAASRTTCTLVLGDSPGTRAVYPWPFRLQVGYALTDRGLRMDLELRNPGTEPLPASLGLHPAFRWPLLTGKAKAGHRLWFEQDEPGPLRRLEEAGLLRPERLPTPIQGQVLPLNETLFAQDALIFLEPRSRGVRFEADGGPSLRLQWEGFPHLGIWTKPDRRPGFLCLEPWEGYASPVDWDGEFAEKPGGFQIPPDATRSWSLTVSLSDPGQAAG